MWQQADHLHIPLLDGDVGIAQIIEVSPRHDHAALCALTSLKKPAGSSAAPLALSEVLAVQFIARPEDQVSRWPIVGFEQIPPIKRVFDLQHHLIMEFADLEPQDPALIEAFVNACHGLYPWDGFPDRELFSNMLLFPDKRPEAAKFKASFA